MSKYKRFSNQPTSKDIFDYESKWGANYKRHPLIHLVDFVPTEWLVSIASEHTDDLASNNLRGEMLSGERLNENLMREGMAHPLIISVNGVGEEIKVRLDCGQHRARVALLLADIRWLPCFVEVSHGKSPVIRNNGPHEHPIDRAFLLREPDIRAQFMKPSDLFRAYNVC